MRAVLPIVGLSLIFSCSSKHQTHPTEKKAVAINSPKAVIISGGNLNFDLVVIDSSSNLCWTKQDFSYMKHRFLNEWKEIFEWQKEMNESNYAGFNDWAVPTIDQYRTIDKNGKDRQKYRKMFLQLDTACVWGHGPYSFWSSTTPNKYTASYISFIDGFATSGDRAKQFSSPYSSWKGVELGMSVRLVRIIRK